MNYDLHWLAEAAKKGGRMLIVRNDSTHSASNLRWIAEAGEGHVIFKDL